MRSRIDALLHEALQGVQTIEATQNEQNRQAEAMDGQLETTEKVDEWIHGVNSKLQTLTEIGVFSTETDIVNYITVLEQYLSEYHTYEQSIKSLGLDGSSCREQFDRVQKKLLDARNLVEEHLVNLRHALTDLRIQEEDTSQTDRTIDSSPMPEEVVSLPQIPEEPTIVEPPQPNKIISVDTQTGHSLLWEPNVFDKSVECKPIVNPVQDVAITCAFPENKEIQTSPKDLHINIDPLESIQIKQTISDGHETLEIASKPVLTSEVTQDDTKLSVDANYEDVELGKESQFQILHSSPQSFEAVMVEPDETTTEVIVDADGTKRIIVRRVRKTLVTRQQTVQTRQQLTKHPGDSTEAGSFSHITLQQEHGTTSTSRDDGGIDHLTYDNFGGQIISALPGKEVSIQEFTSKPNIRMTVEKGYNPEELLAKSIELAENNENVDTQIKTSSSSVTAVVQQITKRIIHTRRRVIRRIVIIDGKEHVTEEIVEEPENIESFEKEIPRVVINIEKQHGVTISEIDDDPSNKDADADKPSENDNISAHTYIEDTKQDKESPQALGTDSKFDDKSKIENLKCSVDSKETTELFPKNYEKLIPDFICEESKHTFDNFTLKNITPHDHSNLNTQTSTSALPQPDDGNISTNAYIEGTKHEKESSKLIETHSHMDSVEKKGLERSEHSKETEELLTANYTNIIQNFICQESQHTSENLTPQNVNPNDSFNSSAQKGTLETTTSAELMKNDILELKIDQKQTSIDIFEQTEEKDHLKHRDQEPSKQLNETVVYEQTIKRPNSKENEFELENIVLHVVSPKSPELDQQIINIISPSDETVNQVKCDVEKMVSTFVGHDLSDDAQNKIEKSQIEKQSLEITSQEKHDDVSRSTEPDINKEKSQENEKFTILESESFLLDNSNVKKYTESMIISEERQFSGSEAETKPKYIKPSINPVDLISQPFIEKTADEEKFMAHTISQGNEDSKDNLIAELSNKEPFMAIPNVELLDEQMKTQSNKTSPSEQTEKHKIEHDITDIYSLDSNTYTLTDKDKHGMLSIPQEIQKNTHVDKSLPAEQVILAQHATIPLEQETKFDAVISHSEDILKFERHIGTSPHKPGSNLSPQTFKQQEQQTIDIKMSLQSDIPDDKPHVSVDLTVDSYGNVPTIIKKNINVGLPSITKTRIEYPTDMKKELVIADVPETLDRQTSETDQLCERPPTRSKKRKKLRNDSDITNSQSEEIDLQNVLNSPVLTETESSSLEKYVQLPQTPEVESPEPCQLNVLDENNTIPQDNIKNSMPNENLDTNIASSNFSTLSEGEGHEIDYEPDESSVSEKNSDQKKIKTKRKMKKHISDVTVYPEVTTAESDGTSIATPIEMEEVDFIGKKKKKKSKSKKLKHSPEDTTVQETYNPSPQPIIEGKACVLEDESIHTISESSDFTVKVVEECTQNITVEEPKQVIDSLLTFTVPIIEAVHTQDYSIQTSPDVVSPEKAENFTTKPTIEQAIQTSPPPLGESIVQTSPESIKNTCTQTIEEIEESSTTDQDRVSIEKLDDVTQTSPIVMDINETIEATTQVKDFDLSASSEKSSQTLNIFNESPIVPSEINITTETREIQTSLDTQIYFEKEDKSAQAKCDTVEIESQTARFESKDEGTSTSPNYSDKVIYLEEGKMNKTENDEFLLDSILPQQDLCQKTTTSEKSLQTVSTNVTEIGQQTTPRQITDDSISSSTDEPFEIHLKTEISVPQITQEFINNEKPANLQPRKKSRQKKKTSTEVPTNIPNSPESLSDPLTTELSYSVTPTSDEISQYTSSVDGAISPQSGLDNSELEDDSLVSQKLTYSDVVRSKSKTPEFEVSNKIKRDGHRQQKLIDIIDRRIKNITMPKYNPLVVATYGPVMEKSFDVVINECFEKVQNAKQSKKFDNGEKYIIVIVENISTWIEEISYEIRTLMTSNIDNPKLTTNTENSLKKIRLYIEDLKETIDSKDTTVSNEVSSIYEKLSQQLLAVEYQNEQIAVTTKQAEVLWQSFVEEIETLSTCVEKLKVKLENVIASEQAVETKLRIIDEIDFENIKCLEDCRRLQDFAQHIVESNVSKITPEKLLVCNELTKQIESSVNSERDRLLQISTLSEEYEQTLKDFSQIADVADALLDGKIYVDNLEHLYEEIQKHRKFFINLSHCRAILESLEENLDNETRLKYSSFHNNLHERATVIIDRAASRAQQITLAASRWSMLEQGMKEEQQWLRVAHQRIPDLANVTSIDHEQYINLYQSVNLDVTHHHAKLLRLLSIAENLQGIINSSGVERECADAVETVLKLQEDIETKLTRLIAFRESWITYDTLVDRIEAWMKIARREVQQISPDLTSAPGNLRRFWELKAQHELHNNLKNNSGTQFERALEILPVSDEMVQRQFFCKLEDEWRALSEHIDNIKSAAIQTVSDRDVPSAQKFDILEEELSELRNLVNGLKGVIKNEDELHLYIERLQVMSGRIERIQDELGRISLITLNVSDKQRSNSLAVASRMISSQIEEELERSILLKERIIIIQAGLTRSRKEHRRINLVLEGCRASERLGSDVVERALAECERAGADLGEQWQALLGVRQALHTLPVTGTRASVSPVQLERDISALQDEHERLEAECGALGALLRERLTLWRRFERQLELVQAAVRETDYMVELLTVQGQVDYERLLKATEKLEGLSAAMSRRSGALVGELRAAAAPLAAACEPAVAARLQKDLDAAAGAYDLTSSNLNHLCDKYHRAVELWRQYREAAAAVRAWSDGQQDRLHAMAPEDAHRHLEACAEQERRVTELRALAARVADETGSNTLRAEADALGRRLQAVCGAVRTLADIGEARQRARARALSTHQQLRRMHQELPSLQEDGEMTETRLVALRDNLLALGRAESELTPATASGSVSAGPGDRDTSLVRMLELWQLTFRDTFSHYHRLSSTLVRSEDAATALRLWREYLLDLESFLSASIPDDYENLAEHGHLCKVHRSLLTAQRSVLLDGRRAAAGGAELADLAAQFAALTDLHDETLAAIADRHDQVGARVAAWERYRDTQTRLLRWLKHVESEKEKLRLRYVHMKRVDGVLSKIDSLRKLVPEGRELCAELLERLKLILEFSGEAYGASVRMESAGVVKRVDNLEAGLETWRDFLARIVRLISEYDSLVTDLQKLYADTQATILSYSDEDRVSRPHVKTLIQKFNELRSAIVKTSAQLESLSVIQEQLKECLSPQDVRSVHQRVWQLRQQQADLEHQLTVIAHRLQERLDVYTEFDSRFIKFDRWLSVMESRFESSQSSEVSVIDPQDLIRRIHSDVEAETLMKEREYAWLIETGTMLVELSRKDEKKFSKETQSRIQDIKDRWAKLHESTKIRISQITQLLETIQQLEERLSQIRITLHAIDRRITQPMVLERLQTEEVDRRSSERDEIQKAIDLESEEIGEVLNHCELVFSDAETLRGNFDIRNLRTGADIVERKWRGLCEASASRKRALRDLRGAVDVISNVLPGIERRLTAVEKRIERVEEKRRKNKNDNAQAENLLKELEDIQPSIASLDNAYADITGASGVELRAQAAEDAARARGLGARWRAAQARLSSLDSDAHRRFVDAHGELVVALAQADVTLTRAQHLPADPDDLPARLRELDGVETALTECVVLAAEADRLAEGARGDGGGVADMAAEYRLLLADVSARLDGARRELGGDVDSAVQVETLRFETDAALQVDTLTSRDTYRGELAAAARDTQAALADLQRELERELPAEAGSEVLAAAARDLARAGAAPAQPLELARHLSELLLTECDASEDEALLTTLGALGLAYEDLLAQAKKKELRITNLRLPHSANYALTCEHESGRLTCPLCSDRNWKQLDNDLWRLEQWLEFAEATEADRTDPPAQYDLLEDAIQEHREFLLDLDSHKSIVVSLNMVGAHVAQHAGDARASAAADLRARLAADNRRWDAACESAARRQRVLQQALLHNHQFHDIVVELVSRLAEAERGVRAREPLRLSRPPDQLRRDFRRFSELRDELERTEPRVHALHDAAQLLRRGDAPPEPQADDICRRLGELRLRLQSLRKLAGVYALKLGAALARHPSQLSSALAAAAASAAPAQLLEAEDELSSALPPLSALPPGAGDEESEGGELSRLQRGLRFVSRVARASLPFQALLLLLLGAAALAPGGPADSTACRPPGLALEPVLRYPDGPPPM